MAKASEEVIAELESAINAAAKGLSKVAAKKMFGCHALFANDNVFGLVWKEGRIGVRLPVEEKFEALMSSKGAAPWKAGAMTMSHWVLVPEGMHAGGAKLKQWVQTAHELAVNAEPKKKKPAVKDKAKTKPVKKVAKKKQ